MKYLKTEAGHTAFKTRSGAIPTRLRSLFILFDGKRSVVDVLGMASGLGATQSDVDYLLQSGLLEPVEVPAVEPPEPAQDPATPLPVVTAASTMELYARALPIATKVTAGLGLRGFRLNLAVEAAMGYEQLCELLPKIRDAVGADKVRELEEALQVAHVPPGKH